MHNLTNDETINTQIKSFTKWVNKQLEKKKYPLITSVVEDFSDGKSLLNLLSVIYGEHIPQNTGNLSNFQKRDNIDRAIRIIEANKIDLVNIDADLIYNKNLKLTLGMTWALILRSISKYTHDESDSNNFKDSLLKWCQKCTKNYKNVNVRDFTTSWKNGLAFNALLHRFAPSIVDYDSLNPKNDKENLIHAFDLAEEHFNITKFLDPEDLTENVLPDEKSIITYLSQYYLKLECLDFKSHLEKGQEYTRNMSEYLNRNTGNYNKKVHEFLLICEEKQQLIKNFTIILQDLLEYDNKMQSIQKIVDISNLYGNLRSSYPIFRRKDFVVDKIHQPDTLFKQFEKISTFSPDLKDSLNNLDKTKSNDLSQIQLHCDILSRQIEVNDEECKKSIISDRNNISFDKHELDNVYNEKLTFINQLLQYKTHVIHRSKTAIRLFETYDPKNTGIINEMNFKNCCLVLNISCSKEIYEDKITIEEYLEYVNKEFDMKDKDSFKVE